MQVEEAEDDGVPPATSRRSREEGNYHTLMLPKGGHLFGKGGNLTFLDLEPLPGEEASIDIGATIVGFVFKFRTPSRNG